MESKTPVYFIGHGGPNIMEDTQHPAYQKLQEIGKEITTKVKPKAIVVFSAHWQGKKDAIQVNVSEKTDLIYDFYGFPPHYYEFQFPNRGSAEIAREVSSKLQQAGIAVEEVERGLDHGVWAPFLCAFKPDENPLDIPIVQVSLFDNEDPKLHYRLGQAVAALRNERIQIIVSGMVVHNLKDLRLAFGKPEPLPYAISFDNAAKEAVTATPSERPQKMAALLTRDDARKAHPTFEHLMPLFVGAGAAEQDIGEQIWTFPQASMSWAQYRFGEVMAH